MEFIEQFITFLSLQKNKPSPLTVKNYKADIRHFITWFEKEFNTLFHITSITPEILTLYKNSKDISQRSMERHFSTLRKFFQLMQEHNNLKESPFAQAAHALEKKQAKSDPWKLKDFKNYLYVYNASSLTIKNYINDIQQFHLWLEQVFGQLDTWIIKEQNLFDKIETAVIEEYKSRLLKTGLSPRSINRKLSSLRKYLSWAQEEGLLGKKPLLSQTFSHVKDLLPSAIITPKPEALPQQTPYSPFPPFRLLQKTFFGINTVFDEIIIYPLAKSIEHTNHVLRIKSKKPLFYKAKEAIIETPPSITTIPKEMYAPLAISTKHFPLYKKILHYIRYARPKWYNRYHNNSISHYIHMAILIAFASTLGIFSYQTLFGEVKKEAVLGLTNDIFASRTLYFQGKLADKSNTAITKPIPVRFALYNSPTSSTSLWDEAKTVTPDKDGLFATMLGETTPLLQKVFSENGDRGLYLGITIGSSPELLPRQQIATSQYAKTAETLQGLPLITQTQTARNVVLALDSSGNLTIGGDAPSTFQATGAEFTLSGQSLVLTSLAGSNGDVVLAPDGEGKIDAQKPIHNTSNNNNITGVVGAVEIADLLSVLATSSGQSAFTVNQNDTGPIISASSSGTAKFTLENDGTTYIAGNVGIGKQNPIAKLQVSGNIAPSETNTYNLGSPGLRFDTLYINSIVASSSGTLGYWQRNTEGLSPSTTSDGITIGASTTGGAIVRLAGASNQNSFVRSGNFGIGTDTPTARLHVQGTGTTTNVSLATFDSNGVRRLSVLDNGNVGIGDSSPTSSLKVVGAICVKNNTQECLGNTAGTVYATNTSLQAADLAENYISSQPLEPGDVVVKADDDNNLSVVKSSDANQQQLLGVISTKPGVTLNSEAKPDTLHPYVYPLGLSGRVPVKVSTENGPIVVGDVLTSSSIPGIAMKAKKAGTVLGKALEPFNCQDATPLCQGKIMSYVTLSWYDPSVYLTNSGDLSIQKIQSENKKTLSYTLKDSAGSIMSTIGSFAEVVAASTATGLLKAQEIVATSIEATTASIDSVTTKKLVSPIAQIDQIHTRVLSPLSENPSIALVLNQNLIEIKNGNSATAKTVATIDSTGNASFAGDIQATNASLSGTLATQNLTVDTDATIAGTLRARRILAEDIEGLTVTTATVAASYITNITNVYEASSSASKTLLPTSLLTSSEIASYSGQLSLETIGASFGKFAQGLIALGPTSLMDTSITGQLSVGNHLLIGQNSINTLGTDLFLQPLRQGNISFLSGLVTIDTEGNVAVLGNASFAKDVSVKGKLSTNVISPLPNQDLVIELAASESGLASSSAMHNAEFRIQNSSGSAVLSINSIGDLIASGTATIKKLNLDSIPKAIAISDTEVSSSSSAGVATISAQQTTLTINTPFITERSLIYITPREQTDNQVLFLLRQVPDTSFTVGIQKPAQRDVPFNWLIVN